MTSMARGTDRRDRLGPRIFAAMAAVIVAGAGCLFLVALTVAPTVFHRHLDMVQPRLALEMQPHVDAAFARAVLVSLAWGVAAAVLAAATGAWLVSRRVARPLLAVATAAEQLARGRRPVTVPDPHLGREFQTLASSINSLSARLDATEQARRVLFADLAHQLRTPVAGLVATTEALLDGVLPVDDVALRALREASQRLHRLVGDLESVSRAEERSVLVHQAPAQLDDVVTAVAHELLSRFTQASVRLVVNRPHKPVPVRVDVDRLAEVLTNILDNALRHSLPGSTVSVTVTTGREHGRADVDVTDHGDGFPPEDADRIFDRFYRGSGTINGEGSGIGLTIARALVEAHGGRLTATSAGRGQGATFRIELPVADGASSHTAAST